jgi:FkbM family methyltransferase
MRLPILAGPLRGRWWLPASRGKILRILGGTYEPEQTRLFEEWIRPGATVLDVGAHVGYYTLVSAVLAGPRGRVVAFEPNPTNHGFLKRHVALNGCGNVEVVQAAVSDAAGTARFDFGGGSGTGHLADQGALEVRTVRVDDVCAERGLAPGAMKIDVEGAELRVLRGAEQTLRRHRPVIFLSTHGAEVHRDCLEWLRGLGYSLSPILGTDLDAATEVLCVPAAA